MKKVLPILVSLLSLFTFSQSSYIVSSDYESGSKTLNSFVKFEATDAGLNSELSEIGSNFFLDKFIILSNKQRRNYEQTINATDNKFNNNVYCVDINKEGKLRLPLLFSKALDSKYDEGGIAFSNKTNTLFYTQTIDDNSKLFKLYAADFDARTIDNWVNVREIVLPEFNSASIENPMYNHNGTKLYFSSNQLSGYGGYDLYVGDVVKGELVNVKNLGSEINTNKDEKYPTMDVNTNYMYFASNKDFGFGGYDIYRASINKIGSHFNSVNLGDTVNTDADEVAFVLQNVSNGFISRNKLSDRNDFDILKFSYILKSIDANLQVVEKESKLTLPNAMVTIIDEFGTTILKAATNDLGLVNFKLDPLSSYKIITQKDGYAEETTMINPEASKVVANPVISLSQLPAVIVDNRIEIENIYFDFNKSSLKEESKLSLNKIVKVLNDKQDVKISIFAHTDTKGKATYNQILSEKRAKSTVDYLIANGVNPERLTYKGYGKSIPKVKCSKCSKDQDALNRRTEFVIN